MAATKQTTNAVLYMRVSSQEQADNGDSLEAQEAKLRTYCAMRDLTITEVVVDAGVSGFKPLCKREGGQQLLALVRSKAVSHVIAMKLDRLFRNTVNCLSTVEEWDKRGVAMHLVDYNGQTLDTRSGMGRFFLTIMAGIAELERTMASERTRAVMTHKRRKGEVCGGNVPYGYQAPSEGKQLAKNDHETRLLETIETLHKQGRSQRKIVEEVTRQGYRTRKNTPLSLMQVHRLIMRFA